jgi:hypothetical protein
MAMRSILATLLAAGGSLVLASTALAMDCTNVSKSDPMDGAQVLIDGNTGDVLWTSTGLAERLERGVVDPTSGEGLHGIIAIDFTGDGSADVSTWFGVGPDGTAIAEPALLNGPACRGLTSLELYFAECLGG